VRYLLVILFSSFVVGLWAQPISKKSYRGKQLDPLARAQEVKERAPEEAIRLINSTLQLSLEQNDFATSAAAYNLLGEIYEDIGQKELALFRYKQADQLLAMMSSPEQRGRTLDHIGRLEALLGQLGQAEKTYQQCLNIKGLSDDVMLLCKEGLADVIREQGAFERSEAIYNSLDGIMSQKKDSLGMARISAKQAQNFISNTGNIQQAEACYSNSIKVLPEQINDYESYQVVEEANRALVGALQNEEEKIEIALNTLSEQSKRSVPAEARLNEQIQLAELTLNSGRIDEAEAVINNSIENFTPDIAPIKKANVYKLRSSIKLKKGEYQSATEDYQRYIEENDAALALQERALAQQAAILNEQAAVDLSIKDYLLKQTEQNLLVNQLRAQRITIILLALLLLAVGIGFIIVRRKEKKRRQANNTLSLKSLRAQMNPHFIFNALNSINNFISRQDERSANKYLADFARLMRMVLDHNQKEFISLEEELQLLELYLKLEHVRFGEQFDYTITKKIDTPLSSIQIAPMLVQPFVENAIWHGLRYKHGKGMLKLVIHSPKNGRLEIKVIDNGIGRSKSKALKTSHQVKYKSTGLNNTHQRVALINELYQKDYQLSVSDADAGLEDTGTIVTLSLPIQ
jgi:two-component system LytT family sensor kinase